MRPLVFTFFSVITVVSPEVSAISTCVTICLPLLKCRRMVLNSFFSSLRLGVSTACHYISQPKSRLVVRLLPVTLFIITSAMLWNRRLCRMSMVWRLLAERI